MNKTIVELIPDRRVFGKLFKDLRTWEGWLVLLSGLFGFPIQDEGKLRILQEGTGLAVYRARRYAQALILAGRRSGKSFISALIACYYGVFLEWSSLARGETPTILILATDKDQARIIFKYVREILRTVDRKIIAKETQFELSLRSGVLIQIHSGSFRSVRGRTLVLCIFEELAFWRDQETSANPAREIYRAILPSLSTVPNSLLLMITTLYTRDSFVGEVYDRNFGRSDAPVFVWRSPTKTLNPTISEKTISEALADDPQGARAEWLSEWREDISTYISLDVIRSLVVSGRGEIAWDFRTTYQAFIDPSSGRSDSFCLAIAHKSGEKIVLDVAREIRPPFNPLKAVAEFSEVLRQYQIKKVLSDSYAVGYVSEAFRKEGISVEASELTASELYLELLPMMNSGSVELLDNPRLVSQFVGLERRTRSAGKDLVTHYSGAHDDLSNATAGAVVNARMRSRKSAVFFQPPGSDFFNEEPRNPMTMKNFDPSSLSEEEADELFDHGFRFRR